MHIKLFLVSIAPCTQRDIVLTSTIRALPSSTISRF